MKLKETIRTEVRQQLLSRLEQLFSKDGYQIVELNYAVLKRRAYFSIVLFHPSGGLSLDSCAELHKIADVEIERLQGSDSRVSENNDYSLALSSPGLRRRLRSHREFRIFCGQEVRCMVDNRWRSGVLLGLGEDTIGAWVLSLEAAAEILRFPLEQISRVELDS